MTITDEQGMQLAISAAETAYESGQLPFGTAIVDWEGRLVSTTGGTETPINPTKHSEMTAIRYACAAVGGRLMGYTIFQTHQPCCMCAGAIAHAKLSRVVYGTKRSDLPHLFRQKSVNCEDILVETHPVPQVRSQVCIEDCLSLWDKVYSLSIVEQGVPLRVLSQG